MRERLERRGEVGFRVGASLEGAGIGTKSSSSVLFLGDGGGREALNSDQYCRVALSGRNRFKKCHKIQLYRIRAL